MVSEMAQQKTTDAERKLSYKSLIEKISGDIDSGIKGHMQNYALMHLVWGVNFIGIFHDSLHAASFFASNKMFYPRVKINHDLHRGLLPKKA